MAELLKLPCLCAALYFRLPASVHIGPGFKDIQAFQSVESDIWGVALSIRDRNKDNWPY